MFSREKKNCSGYIKQRDLIEGTGYLQSCWEMGIVRAVVSFRFTRAAVALQIRKVLLPSRSGNYGKPQLLITAVLGSEGNSLQRSFKNFVRPCFCQSPNKLLPETE